MSTWPALFVSYGAPSLAIEDDAFTQALADWGSRAPQPRAIVAVSAPWEAPGPRVTVHPHPAPVYHFSRFPGALHPVTPPAPGDPPLPGEVSARPSPSRLAPPSRNPRG